MMIIIKKIKEHNRVKETLLKQISQFKGVSKFLKDDSYQKVKFTDWSDNNFELVGYKKTLCNILKNYLEIKYYNGIKIHNIWFQQYSKSDYHNWHNHDCTQMACVYFLELPNKNYATEFYDIEKEKIIKKNIKEGDLIIFPTFMIHRSPIIKDNSRKTVIAFNMDYGDPHQDMLPQH